MFFFFFNDTATTEIYTLSLHDALPISRGHVGHGLAQRPAGRLDRPGAARVGGEHRWQVQRDGHVRSSSTRVVTSRSRGAMTGAAGTAPCTASSVFKP